MSKIVELEKRVIELEHQVAVLSAAVFHQPLTDEAVKTAPFKKKKVAKKKAAKKIEVKNIDLMSDSEIAELCRLKNIGVTRQLRREDLVALLKGESSADIQDPLHKVRNLTWNFINEVPINKANLDCTLQCLTCPYSTVVSCYTVNGEEVEKHDQAKGLDNRYFN